MPNYLYDGFNSVDTYQPGYDRPTADFQQQVVERLDSIKDVQDTSLGEKHIGSGFLSWLFFGK